ncbi:MAG: DUF962 domain-containing protein [Maricaulaceae bacterium]
MTQPTDRYQSFKDFYPYYLSEHEDVTCRRLHFVGSSLIVALFIGVVLTQNWVWLLLTPVIGYGFAWVGHVFYEKNRPATFTYPLWSLMGDWKMWFEILTGKVSIAHP